MPFPFDLEQSQRAEEVPCSLGGTDAKKGAKEKKREKLRSLSP